MHFRCLDIKGRYEEWKNVWFVLRGITLWMLWIECNDLVFNNEK